MHTKVMKLSIWIFSFLFLLSSCTKLDDQTKQILISSCEAPCWYGILPGKTEYEAVKKALETLTIIDRSSIQEIPFQNENYPKRISWDFSDGGVGTITIRKDKVENIVIEPVYGKVVVSNILELFGEPDFIVYSRGGGDCSSSSAQALVYRKGVIAMVLGCFSTNYQDNIVNKNSLILHIEFGDENSYLQNVLSDSEITLINSSGLSAIDRIVPWEK
jgi:hypothetical protein